MHNQICIWEYLFILSDCYDRRGEKANDLSCGKERGWFRWLEKSVQLTDWDVPNRHTLISHPPPEARIEGKEFILGRVHLLREAAKEYYKNEMRTELNGLYGVVVIVLMVLQNQYDEIKELLF